MVEKLALRKQRENAPAAGGPIGGDRLVSDTSLFNELGGKLKRIQ